MNSPQQTSKARQRIGLFGGTFNPIHLGHVQVAKDVQRLFGLDHIHFIPCDLPPHKGRGALAPARERFEMVRLALKDLGIFSASDLEIRRGGPSFTIDTLHGFKSLYAQEADFFFLVGMDAYVEIHTWKSYTVLFDLSAFIVMTRPTAGEIGLPQGPQALEYARRHLSGDYALSPDGGALIHPQKKPIYLAAVTPMDIASSQIRDKLRHGEPVHEWVDPVVFAYMDEKGLYR